MSMAEEESSQSVEEAVIDKGVEESRSEPNQNSDKVDESRTSAGQDTALAGAKPTTNTSAKVGASKEEKSVVTKSTKGKKAKAGSKYTFFVGPGNNGELVRATLEHRPWWELGKEDDPELNLKWLQVSLHFVFLAALVLSKQICISDLTLCHARCAIAPPPNGYEGWATSNS